MNSGNPLDAWVAYSDTLFPTRFASLVNGGGINPDIIEIQSWNDFCESHYIRNLPSQDINAKDFVELGQMGAYVYGQDHSPWRLMAKYYIGWWKTGSRPAVTQDQVVFWHRTHPKNAICSSGSSTGVRNSQMPVDAVFAWALVSQPSTISMSVGVNKYWTFRADSTGPSMGMVPFPKSLASNVSPEVAIVRGGKTVAVNKSSRPIEPGCSYPNFNPVVNLVTV